MQERVFRADRLDAALAQVKAELGQDAVIVSTRHERRPGHGGRVVEVTALAASDAPVVGHVRAPVSRNPLERRLVRVGVPPSATRTLVGRVMRLYGGIPSTTAAAIDALGRAISEEMVFASAMAGRVVALVGPTGVGKTTTIAKIAAQASLVERRKVAVVSVDHYRIGGAEQLEQYANLIGIPMEIAHDGASLEIGLRRLNDADLILLDTAGRSPRDTFALAALAETLQSAQEPIETHLCLPAATRETELQATIDLHAVLRPTRLDITKVDEAVHHGAIVGAQVASGLPLTYFTTGQRVPEDIEIATSSRLAALLCGEEVN